MQTIIIFGLLATFLALVIAVSLEAIGRLGEDDMDDEDLRGYVDQDGESTPGPYDRDAWRHASVKVPRAEDC